AGAGVHPRSGATLRLRHARRCALEMAAQHRGHSRVALLDHVPHADGRVIRKDIDALLFDFGGVLVQIDFDRVCARWAELAGRPVGEVRARFKHGAAYERHERAEIDMAAYCDSLRADLGIELDDAAL